MSPSTTESHLAVAFSCGTCSLGNTVVFVVVALSLAQSHRFKVRASAGELPVVPTCLPLDTRCRLMHTLCPHIRPCHWQTSFGSHGSTAVVSAIQSNEFCHESCHIDLQMSSSSAATVPQRPMGKQGLVTSAIGLGCMGMTAL